MRDAARVPASRFTRHHPPLDAIGSRSLHPTLPPPLRSVSCAAAPGLLQPNVLVLDRQIVDSTIGRCDPAGDLARLGHSLHEAAYESAIGFARQPLRQP